jgi:hypothetical protein
MPDRKGAGPATARTVNEARKIGTGKRRKPSKPSTKYSQAWSLFRGRSRAPLVRVVPDHGSALYRIAWPDIGLSPAANLARCLDAARAWAERNWATEQRNLSVAQRLKSLRSFSWSASPMRQIDGGGNG